MDVTDGGAAEGDDKVTQACLYCANLEALRNLLPPKQCDYCHKWRCQFCTLKFPLLGVRKRLFKKLKGNSRICIQCFGQIWQENEAASSSDVSRRCYRDSHCTKHVSLSDTQGIGRESRGVRFVGIEPGRRISMVNPESMMSSNRRSFIISSDRQKSLLESERRMSLMVDQVSARSDSFDNSRRLLLADEVYGKDLVKQTGISKARRGGIPYRVASFLGLVASDGPGGTSMSFAIGLWMSLFAASILLVVALADGFTLHQRLWYCVATYVMFLTLHPMIHADGLSGFRPSVTERTAQSNIVASPAAARVKTTRRKSSTVPGNGPVPPRLQEMKETLAHY